MVHEVFYWIFNMSITASITGLLVVLLRLIKAIPRRVIKILWVIPFFRMIVPVGINSRYSVMTLMSKISTKTIKVYEFSDEVTYSMLNSVQAAETYFPITYKVNIFEKVFAVSSIIWVTVLLIIVLFFILVYVKSLVDLQNIKHLSDNIYISDKIKSPAVYGVFRPKIVLSEVCLNDNLKLIVEHEKVHIRHMDNLWRIFSIFIVAIHWFNPLCWMFLRMFITDLEMSCDEFVISKLGESNKKEYALILFDNSVNNAVVHSNFGGSNIKARINNILTYKRITIFSFCSFMVLILFLFYVTLTNS